VIVHQNGGSNAMTDILSDANFSRRDLLKGGGVLIVGFSMTGAPPESAAAARGEVVGPPDPNAIDSWIAVHADNTATVYFGKCELGQGNTTGMLQIAGEELADTPHDDAPARVHEVLQHDPEQAARRDRKGHRVRHQVAVRPAPEAVTL
jgi:hypothetical protein